MHFLDALVTGRYGQYVQGDLATGLKLGIKEAPTFFINGKKFIGDLSIDQMAKEIDPYLKDG